MSSPQAVDVLVLGGGLAGAAFALSLRDTGKRVAIVDGRPLARGPGRAADPRAYAISPAAARFLTDIGVWRHLGQEQRAPVAAMDIRGDLGGRLRFSAYEARCEALAWMVEADRLESELRETARRQTQLQWFAPAHPTRIEQGQTEATVTLNDGQRIAAQLVVGADGRDSWLRQATGIAAAEVGYGEQGIAGSFRCELPHGDTARQWFLRDSVLAWLPLPGQRISIVWSAPDALAKELMRLSPDRQALRVAAAGDHALGRLDPAGPAGAFPLKLIRVADPIASRVALIGDAAHGIHPLSGHGINLGFVDARELATVIKRCRPGEDVGHPALLRRYRRARAEEVRLLQEATHGLRRLFGSELPGASMLRNFGLTAVDRLPRVKSLLTRYAMG